MHPLAILALFLFPQDEPTVEQLIEKIEARVAPIHGLTADIELHFSQAEEQGVQVLGRLEFARGKFLRRQFGLWSAGEAMFVLDDYFSEDLAASKLIFSIGSEGSVVSAVKIDPKKPVVPDRGFLGTILLWTGLENLLADVALVPGCLRAYGTDLRVVRGSAGDRALLGLEVTRSRATFSKEKSQSYTMTWFFDAAHYRAERLEMALTGQKVVVEVVEYERVNGVEIPRRVRGQSGMDFLGEGTGLTEIALRYVPGDPPSEPAWFRDAAVPFATKDDPDTLRARIKKDPKDAASALALAGAIWMSGMMDRANFKGASEEICGILRTARDAAPESAALATALYCGYVTSGKPDEAKKLREELVGEKVACPELHLVHAMQLLGAGMHQELVEAADRMGSDGIYGRLSAVLRLAGRAAGTATAEDLVRVVNEACAGMSAQEKLDRLRVVAFPPAKRSRGGGGVLSSKSVSFLEELGKQGKPEFVLLAARGFVLQGKPKEAAELYVRAAADPDFRPHLGWELAAFCASAKEDAGKVLDLILDEVADVEVLIAAADSYLDQKADEKLGRALKRVIQVLREEKSKSRPYRNADPAKAFLKKLVEAGRVAVAREFLVAFADKTSASSFLYGNDDLVPKILGDDEEAKIDFLESAGVTSHSMGKLGLTPAGVWAALKKRIDAGHGSEADFDGVASYVTDGTLLLEAKPEEAARYLEKAVAAYPKRPEFHERLADAYFLSNQTAKAISSFCESLKRLKEEGEERNPFVPMSVSTRAFKKVSGQEEVSKPEFDPAKPVVVKLVFAHLKAEDRPGAVAAVEQYLKDFTDEKSLQHASEAYEILELPDRILVLKKKLFLGNSGGLIPGTAVNDPKVGVGVELTRLYLQHGKLEEAYIVSEMTLELTKSGDRTLTQSAEEARQAVLKVFREEDLVKGYASGPFAPVSDAKKLEVETLLAQLEEEEPFVRQEAEEKLRGLGPEITPLLFAALQERKGEAASRLLSVLVAYARKALRERFEKP